MTVCDREGRGFIFAYVRTAVNMPRPLQVAIEQSPRAFSLEVNAHVDDAGHRTHPFTKLEVRRPFRFKDMSDFRSRY